MYSNLNAKSKSQVYFFICYALFALSFSYYNCNSCLISCFMLLNRQFI